MILRFPPPSTCLQCQGKGGWHLAKLSEYAIKFETYWHPCNTCKGTGRRPKIFRPKLP
jgi:DnaJ-class molecular chaperone